MKFDALFSRRYVALHLVPTCSMRGCQYRCCIRGSRSRRCLYQPGSSQMKESAKPQVLLDYFISQDMGRGYLSCLTDSLRCAESPVIRLSAVVSAVPMNMSSTHSTFQRTNDFVAFFAEDLDLPFWWAPRIPLRTTRCPC